MNIAFLHRDLPPEALAGVAVQAHRLANALCRAGHEVTVFTLSQRPPDALYGVHGWGNSILDFCRNIPGLKRLWAPWACRGLDFSGFDVVHIHGDGGLLRYGPRFLRTFYGTAALEAAHARAWRGRLAQLLSYALEKREARQCRHNAAISAHVRDFLPGIQDIIPCATAQGSEPGALKSKTAAPSLIYLGSQGGRKRGERALELLRTLRSEFADLELHYVGPESERSALENNPRHPGLRFYSRLPEPDLMGLFRHAWVYVGFSSYEGFGVPWAEAMSLGCCVVTTPHAAALEWLRDGENALLRAPELIPETVAGLLRAPEKRLRLAENGFATAAEFAPERVADRYLALYHRVVEAG